MAGEVGLQSDVYLDGAAKPRTLHLKTLRRQWQIIALQVVATVALIGMLAWYIGVQYMPRQNTDDSERHDE